MIHDGENQIKLILNSQELDVRKTHDGRWIDQKCTPDVICAIADIVDTLVSQGLIDSQKFNSEDVWYSDYSIEFIPSIFDKAKPSSPKAKSEYNKFFQQPLNLLSYSGILSKYKVGRTNYYKVNSLIALQYIGMSDRNSLKFLRYYITKVLKASGIYHIFENFLKDQTDDAFKSMKDNFVSFCQINTNIKRELEPKRIFTKVINPLSQKEHKLGSVRGHISKEVISFADLMYNQKNFFDIYAKKPKDVSRKTWLKQHPIEKSQEAKFALDSKKAKKYVKRINDELFGGVSELRDHYSAGKATQMHHMFPSHQYPEISGYNENIIALTPTQHFTKAHPDNNTQIIDDCYLELLLKAKLGTIDKSLKIKNIEQIYSFARFDHVLNVGFIEFNSPDDDLEDANFHTSMNKINHHFRKNNN
ncbi:restriction endonuclease [Apilactobacillus zhangqiuensis]|uniref:restriction endonuclease n=1 Tax=Apilactobacillus zhangqiuensis TaxID=2841031 RepID=UPI001C7E0CCA|nr:restriction endonuclease [Apilactobacillus zhangqiuensis]